MQKHIIIYFKIAKIKYNKFLKNYFSDIKNDINDEIYIQEILSNNILSFIY